LTFNEEANLRFCLDSVKDWADQIFIVDSFSTDRTLEIAGEYTDNIHQNPWRDWAHQRNWALEHLPLQHDWVLFLDADERLTEGLRREMAAVLAGGPSPDGFYIRRHFFFLGKWLRHGGYQKDYVLRLVRRQKARSLGSGAREYVTVQGALGKLQHPMVHEDRKGLGFWVDKHNKLASLEALELQGFAENHPGLLGTLETAESRRIEHRARIWLRERVWVRLPGLIRPIFYFLYRYVFQLGFLDGKEGLIYCFLHGFWYPFLIDAKYLELKKGVPPPGP
jgi:glycosyltransferase involved in cell wall biosynthesis